MTYLTAPLSRSLILPALLIGLLVSGCSAGTPPGDTLPPGNPEVHFSPDTTAPLPDDFQIADPDRQANADVVFVKAILNGESWTFQVTVSHPDTGWEDYADGWDVITSTGEVVKINPDDEFTRALLHPHLDEQPFTRSQTGLVIPSGIYQVVVRAHDLLDGFGGQEIVVDLTRESGEGYQIVRPD